MTRPQPDRDPGRTGRGDAEGAEVQRAAFQGASYHLLARLASGAPLQEMLSTLAITAEEVMPGSRISVLQLDETRTKLVHGAAPSLPEYYRSAIDGVLVGPGIGSCGHAAATGETVIVRDTWTDPKCAPFKDLLKRAGLRGVCSVPIFGSGGDVLGAFAMFSREPREPEPFEIDFIRAASQIAGLAIERKRVEDELEHRERRMRLLTDSLPVLISRINREERYDFNNLLYEEWFGVPREQLIGMSLREALGEKAYAAIQGRLHQAFAGETVHYETAVSYPDGIARQVSVHYIPDRTADGTVEGVIALVHDITDRVRRAEGDRRLRERTQRAQRLESLGVLAGGIAHDFNNLLMVILGNADLIETELPKNSPLRELVGQITVASDQAAQLCAQMLSYAGKGRLQVRLQSLSELIEVLRPVLVGNLAEGAQVEFDVPSDLPAVEGDSLQLRQVLLNLVRNAADAGAQRMRISGRIVDLPQDETPDTGDHLGVQLFAGLYACLEVWDDGDGIPEEERDRIFEPFYTTKTTGHGLGLSSVLGIVRAHGGAIQVESASGCGTTFRVLLPAIGSPMQGDPGPSPPREAVLGLERGEVLLVEDERPIRQVAKTMLQQLGLEVIDAESGERGLELAKNHLRHLRAVLLDLSMPGMDGLEVFHRLRALRADLPIVFCSGHAEVHGLDGGAVVPDAYLQKPFRRQDLANVLYPLLRRSKD